jgi:crotonobetainyl-CoA:carnitine CoA-transferase CaiB-like acyl-CoA transferase
MAEKLDETKEREKKTGPKALKGVRVLEMGSLIGGPFCGTLMAEFGAEVIKVEDPKVGDAQRHFRKSVDNQSLAFAYMGRNKKCITIDLRVPEGQELFKRLIPFADVVIENFRVGTLKGWNLEYSQLSQINPRLIMNHVSGYGQYGPYKDRPAFDRIATAFSGQDFITGFPDKPPTRPGGALADYITGLFGTIGTMFALYYRDVNGGKGQEIDLALYEGIFRCINQVEEHGAFGVVNQRMGNVNPYIAPAETFVTKDGQWMVVHAATDNVWKRFIKVINREDLDQDPKYNGQRARAKNQDELHALIAEWIKQRSLEELTVIFEKAGVPATKVNSIADIFKDPHFQARENIIDVLMHTGKKIKSVGIVPKLSLTPGQVEFVAPPLGAHNEEIYLNLLKLSREEYENFKKRGII